MNYKTIIDLGTTKVVGLVGEETPYGCKVLAFSENPSQGVKRGEVENINQVLDAMKPCIADLEEQIGKRLSKVFVGIAGQHIRSQAECNKVNRSSTMQEITAEEIEELEQNMYSSRVEPGEEVLHVIPQFYHVDDRMEIRDPVGMMGSKIEANYRLFIGRTNSAENTKRCIERAGLKLEHIILEPLASAMAVLTDDEKELGVAMVDIGGGTTDLLVYYDNVIRHAAVIPFGGNVITEDIRHGCGVPLLKAEEIKKQYGSCYSDLAPTNKTIVIPVGGDSREISFGLLASIIEARMSEIMDAVLYEIENSGYAERLRAGIVLTGGGAQMNHLVQYVKFKTGYHARIAKPVNVEEGSCPEVNGSAYSCAVGLLLKGFEYEGEEQEEKTPIWVNLFGFPTNTDKRSRKSRREASDSGRVNNRNSGEREAREREVEVATIRAPKVREPKVKESKVREQKVREQKKPKENGPSFEERFNRFFQLDNEV